jgi:hypothetical protein
MVPSHAHIHCFSQMIMTILSILVRVSIGSLPTKILKHSWVPYSFSSQMKAKILTSCLYLFDAIVELHAMDENCSMTGALESESESVIKSLFHSWYIFVYLVEASITSNQRAQYIYMTPFSSILLVYIHLFFYTNLLYLGVLIS